MLLFQIKFGSEIAISAKCYQYKMSVSSCTTSVQTDRVSTSGK